MMMIRACVCFKDFVITAIVFRVMNVGTKGGGSVSYCMSWLDWWLDFEVCVMFMNSRKFYGSR